LHRGQVRKGTTIPYVSHLLAVCVIVLEHGGREDEAIAALLHDGPEDQGGSATLEAIRSRFGDAVADIVAECSDTFERPKRPWAERKQRYLARLDRDGVPPSVLLVSAADKLHNLRSTLSDFEAFGDALWDRFRGSPAQQVWYYSALADVYRRRSPGRLANSVADAAGRLAAVVRAGSRSDP
jgi:(p)ppGpp synthase/HD superfamily hydrolase